LGLPEHKVSVQIGWEILEDNSWVDADDSLLATPIDAPEGWLLKEGQHNIFEGTVVNKPALFAWKSKPYKELWTLRPYMRVLSQKIALSESGQ
jgi:hypothetical protein